MQLMLGEVVFVEKPLEDLISKIRKRLSQNAYPNEAAISSGVVLPILRELGWDDTDPSEIMPEYPIGAGRVDFAICAVPKKPSFFIEVKGVGRSLDGDRQLFEYAFHQGVPFCILTDGKDWNFYLPGGQGDYNEGRIYRLQLEERNPLECAAILSKYIDKQRVKSGVALDDASREYRNSASKREASRSLPQAWSEMVAEPDELLLDLLGERAEKLSGVKPDQTDVLAFLNSMSITAVANTAPAFRGLRKDTEMAAVVSTKFKIASEKQAKTGREVSYSIHGKSFVAANGREALIAILSKLSAIDPIKIPTLAAAVQGASRNHIARTVEEIYPARPDLARAEEFFPGWLVGLNIANREKLRIVRTACDVFELSYGKDVTANFPNSES